MNNKIQQIKDEVAARHGYENFAQISVYIDIDKMIGNQIEDILDDCMKEIAKQTATAQREACYDNYIDSCNDILNTPLVTD